MATKVLHAIPSYPLNFEVGTSFTLDENGFQKSLAMHRRMNTANLHLHKLIEVPKHPGRMVTNYRLFRDLHGKDVGFVGP